jgi:hypothetical protein
MLIHVVVFWDITPCSLMGEHKCFGGTYCLQFYPEDGGGISLRNVGTSLLDYTVP